jgi:hypothetical protein
MFNILMIPSILLDRVWYWLAAKMVPADDRFAIFD